jgi:hypothetical protein
MAFITYLTTPSPQFGTLAWLFFILQILGVAAGAYLVYAHTERNPARLAFLRQLGIALLVVGGVALLMAALRLLNVPVVNQRLWFWITLLIELALAGYLTYYVRNVLPGLEQAQAGRRPARAQPRGMVSESAPAAPRPVPITSRRDARRDRKRKSK